MKILAGSASQPLAKNIADVLGLTLSPTKTARFPDGEIDVVVEDSCHDQVVYIVQSLAIKPNSYLIELLLMADCAKRLGAKAVVAVIPYLAYMRQDRIQSHHAYAAPAVAKMLSQAFDHIIYVEPHVSQVSGFFSIPVNEISTAALFKKHLLKRQLDHAVVVSPDAGGLKRAELVKGRDTPIAVIEKTRSEEGIEMNQVLGDVSGKDCVIIDDVIASGQTIIQAASLLKQHGAQSVYVYATHAVIPENLDRILQESSIDELIVTDTIPLIDKKYAKLSVISEIVASIRQLNGDSDEDQSRS